jgi:NAD(P)-dependent dehydrogenase (short-subunit alcohol dehydrogenase family)
MGRLDGKVVVITGAGGGIGREAALLFSDEGASVCVADMSRSREQVRRRREAFFQPVDVADQRQAMRATAERYGSIDVLYNSAGIMPDGASILDTGRTPGSACGT